jgi:putative acetyltransferase
VESHINMGAVVHRLATLDDAAPLFEVRRRSILALAPPVMSIADAEAWAGQVTLAGMEQKLRELEIWIAEREGVVAGWGGIRGDCLEALYTAPEYAGQGIGAALLDRLEELMRGRGVDAIHAEASANALSFYLRRGYRVTGPQTPVGAWPITRQVLG